MICRSCKYWLIRDQKVYDNDEIIIKWKAPESQGKCTILKVLTEWDFGCKKHEEGGPLVTSEHKSGEPWQHSIKGPCPDCKEPQCGFPECTWQHCPGPDKCIGNPALREGHAGRCMGTGKVNYYDDGFIGENRTCKHPKEIERQKPVVPVCQRCTRTVALDWNMCPFCGQRLREINET